MTAPTKRQLLEEGKALASWFCELNGLVAPTVQEADTKTWPFGVCAYYRKGATHIAVERCATIGTAGMQWSYPGHSVDRTPYGVLQHELGHHVDWTLSAQRGAYFGDYSVTMRAKVQEAPLTSYCPNDAEWFAEMFRLFVTNPDLLRQLRPRTHEALMGKFVPAFMDDWRVRLVGAPERTITSIERKLSKRKA